MRHSIKTITLAFIFTRDTRKEDQAAIELAWKEEKQHIKSEGNGGQSYSTIENGQD